MKKHVIITLIILSSLFGSGVAGYAQGAAPAVVTISGEVANPLTLSDAMLLQYKQITVSRKDKDGKDHQYSGPLLSDILQSAGVTLGAELKGKNLTKYLLVGAGDGYKVVFALPELDKNYTDRLIILADKMDGKPLPPTEGPFKIVVQDEKKPARCIRMVTTMQVLFAK